MLRLKKILGSVVLLMFASLLLSIVCLADNNEDEVILDIDFTEVTDLDDWFLTSPVMRLLEEDGQSYLGKVADVWTGHMVYPIEEMPENYTIVMEFKATGGWTGAVIDGSVKDEREMLDYYFPRVSRINPDDMKLTVDFHKWNQVDGVTSISSNTIVLESMPEEEWLEMKVIRSDDNLKVVVLGHEFTVNLDFGKELLSPGYPGIYIGGGWPGDVLIRSFKLIKNP